MSCAGNFVIPTFALASQFPELDPIALLQLVEAPVVRMAFYEFRQRFWDHMRAHAETHWMKNGKVALADHDLRKSIETFNLWPEGESRLEKSIRGGGGPSNFAFYHRDPIPAFLSRVYAWVTQSHLNLPICKHLDDPTIRTRILWGILGICIGMHEEGDFPQPICPIPANVDTDNNLDEFHTRVSGSLGYDARWFPAWQEWRTRHERFERDTEARNRYILYWAAWTAGENGFGLGENSPARECERFLMALDFIDPEGVRRYYTAEHHTKHLIITSPGNRLGKATPAVSPFRTSPTSPAKVSPTPGGFSYL
ncbi:hypothetical protein EKO27_g10010 [Xylaria grammica]|uniref:Uncharacterized protein n=1 Tax=Xylaria grammica TaxID=363999 RepID=A0A439CSC9_9PEZI|nr:hypothetical protein EKO27_g10010 [Xylaria grammica]